MARKSRVFEEVNIRILPMQEKVQVEERINGITSVKSIALNELITCFEKGIRDEKQFASGFLPENCLHFSISSNSRTLILLYPHQRVDYTYHKTTYENFPLPKMVFRFTLNSAGKVCNCAVAVIADERLLPGTQLYHFPFSNVYADGGICIGVANELPIYKNLWALGGLPHHILSLPNNDHNFVRTNNRLKLGYRELLEHMQDKDSRYYYDHVLVPREGKTLQHFIDGELGGKYG